MTPDVNVIVAASRSDHPHHAVALDGLISAIDAARSGASLMLSPSSTRLWRGPVCNLRL